MRNAPLSSNYLPCIKKQPAQHTPPHAIHYHSTLSLVYLIPVHPSQKPLKLKPNPYCLQIYTFATKTSIH